MSTSYGLQGSIGDSQSPFSPRNTAPAEAGALDTESKKEKKSLAQSLARERCLKPPSGHWPNSSGAPKALGSQRHDILLEATPAVSTEWFVGAKISLGHGKPSRQTAQIPKPARLETAKLGNATSRCCAFGGGHLRTLAEKKKKRKTGRKKTRGTSLGPGPLIPPQSSTDCQHEHGLLQTRSHLPNPNSYVWDPIQG